MSQPPFFGQPYGPPPDAPYGPPPQQPYGAQPYPPPGGLLPPEAWPYVKDTPGAPPVLAGPGQRLGGYVLDAVFILLSMLVLYVLFAAVAGMVIGAGGGDPADRGFLTSLLAALAAVLLLYDPIQTAMWGRTLGKRCVGTRVVLLDEPSRLPGFPRALARWLVRIPMAVVPFLGLLNSLWLLWDRPNHQCLHDKVAGTVVIRNAGKGV